MINAGTVQSFLELDTSRFSASLRGAGAQLATFSNNSNSLNSRINNLGGALSTVGVSLSKGLTLPLTGFGAICAKTAATFESSMSQVKAVSGATGEDFEKLKASAKELGATTAFSATEASQGMKYLAMAGYDTNEIIQAMPGLLDLAAASGTDLATTSDIVSDSMTAFGLSAKDTTHFADMLAMASSSANTDVVKMGESFKYAAPVAASFGMSAEETAAAISIMGNSGIKAGQAGTTLRGALSKLLKPSKDAGALMKQYGIDISDAQGNMLPFPEIMSSMRTAFSSMDEVQKNQAATTLFGTEALSGMLAIVNTSDEEFNTFTQNLTNSSGAAKNMADVMLDNLNGSITLLKSALEGMMISIGERLIPLIKSLTEKINSWVTWFNSLSESTKDMVVKIGLIVAAIGPMLLIFGKVISILTTLFSTIGTITTAFSVATGSITTATGAAASLGTAFSVLTGPIGLVVAAIAGLIAIFATLYKTNEEFRTNVNACWENIKTSLSNIWNSIKELGMTIFNLLKEFWNTWGEDITSLFTRIFDSIFKIIESTLNIIQNIINVIMGVITGDWQKAWDGIKEILGSIFDIIKEILSNALATMADLIKINLKITKSIWSAGWNVIKNIVSTVWNVIKGIISTCVNLLISLIKGFLNAVKFVWETIWNGIKLFLETIWDGIKIVITTYIEIYKTIITKGLEIILGIWKKLWELFVEAIKTVWENIKTWVETSLTNVSDLIKGAWESFKGAGSDLFQAMWDGMTEVYKKIKKWISGTIEWLKDKTLLWGKAKESVERDRGAVSGNTKYFAKGTNNAPRGWHWVGEQGPELRYFNGGETVINSAKSLEIASNLANSNNLLNPNTNHAINNFEIDYEKLGQVIARNSKDINVNSTFYSPDPLTPNRVRENQEQLLRDLEFNLE